MNIHTDKTQENKSQAVANAASQKQGRGESSFQFADNRPEAIAQRKLQEIADNYFIQQQQPVQKKENNTGLPDNLKVGIENLSGLSMEDVKVHYNSDKPAQLQAHAYAQGTDIHLASGQEKYLPHEAWHVVQQKQGRVKPTIQMKGKKNINDDSGLEKEADEMGAKASNLHPINNRSKTITQRKVLSIADISNKNNPIQRRPDNINRIYYMNSDHQGNPVVDPADRTGLLPGSIQGIKDTYILDLTTIGGHLFKREWGGADDFSNVVNWTPTEEDSYTAVENNCLAMIGAYGRALNSRPRMNARERGGFARQMNDRSRFEVKAKFKTLNTAALGDQIEGHEQDSTNVVKWDFLAYIQHALETFADNASMKCETRLNQDLSGIPVTPDQAGGHGTTIDSGNINGPDINTGSLDIDQIRSQYVGLVTQRDLYIGIHQASIDALKQGRVIPGGFKIREAVAPSEQEQATPKNRTFGKKAKRKANKFRR